MKRFLVIVLALLLFSASLVSCSLQKKGAETAATEAVTDLPPQPTGAGTERPGNTTVSQSTPPETTTAPETTTSETETPPEDPDDGEYTKNY